MKQFKKYLPVAMILIFAVALLAGCSSGKPKETGGGSKAEVTKGAEPGTSGEEPYEIAVEVVNIYQDYADLAEVEAAINEITLPAINCSIKLKPVPIPEQGTKLSLAVAANEKLDLVNAGLLSTPGTLAGEGLLTDITDYLTPALKELAGDLLSAGTINGRVYSYPCILYPGQEAAFIYDKDLADQYNITVPDTISSIEDWNKIFEQIKASGMSPYGISLGDGGGASITEFGANFDALGDNNSLSYGVVVDPANNTTITNWYESQEFYDMCKDHYDWMQNGYCVPDSLTNGYTTIDSITNGQSFGATSSIGIGSNLAYWSNLTGKNLAKAVIRDALLTTGYTNTQAWGVASNCEKPEKVIQFLDLLFTNTDLANLINYGIEGKHYVKLEGTQNIITYPEGTNSSTVGYAGDMIQWFGDTKKVFQRTPNTDEFFATIDNYGLAGATKSNCLGYTFDTANVTTQLTAVQNVVNEYKATLTTGNVNPEEAVPGFIQALKDAGIDEIIKENQSQLDAWLAAK
ncbi:MAG TPA: ABC transporter substrate-binding protein [Clostridiales bacterium]|nr:ABC transporter substrate-binding protein [Clostridiales bacterium]